MARERSWTEASIASFAASARMGGCAGTTGTKRETYFLMSYPISRFGAYLETKWRDDD